jgi:hypothetical protein
MPRSTAGVAKRIATGLPLPSPNLNVDPLAVVTRRFPLRTSLSNTTRSNRSIGRLLTPVVAFASPQASCPKTPRPRRHAQDAMAKTQLASTGVAGEQVRLRSTATDSPSRTGELKQSLFATATRMSCRELRMT